MGEKRLPEFNLPNETLRLNQIAEGDQKAFTSLVDTYWNKVYSHALAYVKAPARAKEITQDVFLKLWNQRSVLPEINNFSNFLFILSKNEIISGIRKNLESATGPDIMDVVQTPELALSPDKQLEYKQVYHLIMQGIDQLPPTRQRIFKLSRLDGKTYEEIATELNISKYTVKEHIVLALSFLRTYVYTKGEFLPLIYLLGSIQLHRLFIG